MRASGRGAHVVNGVVCAVGRRACQTKEEDVEHEQARRDGGSLEGLDDAAAIGLLPEGNLLAEVLRLLREGARNNEVPRGAGGSSSRGAVWERVRTFSNLTSGMRSTSSEDAAMVQRALRSNVSRTSTCSARAA